MLLGDLLTAVAHELPVKLVVFDNGRLGMVKLEQEQVGLPEFGTVLDNPDFAAVAARSGCTASGSTDPRRRSTTPSRAALAHPGPGPARRRHQPRRDRAAAQAHARAGLGLRHRQDQGVRRLPGVTDSAAVRGERAAVDARAVRVAQVTVRSPLRGVDLHLAEELDALGRRDIGSRGAARRRRLARTWRRGRWDRTRRRAAARTRTPRTGRSRWSAARYGE